MVRRRTTLEQVAHECKVAAMRSNHERCGTISVRAQEVCRIGSMVQKQEEAFNAARGGTASLGKPRVSIRRRYLYTPNV